MAVQTTNAPGVNTQLNNRTIEANDLMELYWNFYGFHAEQRMKILEFFISLETALFGATFVAMEKMPSFTPFANVAIVIVSIVCYLLEKRTTDLMHTCRVAIRKLEEDELGTYDEKMKLFNQVKNTEKTNNYSKVIRSMYFIVAIIGVVMFIMAKFFGE